METIEGTVYKVEREKLRKFFLYSAKGMNNVKVSEALGVHRTTVQRWVSELKVMPDDEFMRLLNTTLKTENPVDRKMIREMESMRAALNAMEDKIDERRKKADQI